MINQPFDFDYKLHTELQAGNRAAFTTIFNQYARLLYALAFRYLKSAEEAEDAVQHTFMRLWEQRESFDFQMGVRSLLFTILKNYVLNELRHRKIVFEKHYEIAQEANEISENFLKDFENKDFRSHLNTAINKLPSQKRKICLLKIDQKLSNQEIADEMGITVPTVKSHYTQVIKILRQEIKKLLVFFQLLWIYPFDSF